MAYKDSNDSCLLFFLRSNIPVNRDNLTGSAWGYRNHQSTTVQCEAESRVAIAGAERAELAAPLPPSSIKPLQGSIGTRQFGAAGLKAFDLARELAPALHRPPRPTARPPSTSRRPPSASRSRQVSDAIEHLKDNLIAYGDGARRLFTTLLSLRCPDKLAGLGSDYPGDLDGKQYATLLARACAGGAARQACAANDVPGQTRGCREW